MIIDTLDNLEKYASLNPLFAKAIEFLKNTDLKAQPVGKVELDGKNLVVNFSVAKGKTKEQAQLETHKKFIDIQIPLSCTEVMGYTPACDLPEGEYNAEKDITKFAIPSESYIGKIPTPLSSKRYQAIISPDGAHQKALYLEARPRISS